MKKLKRKIKKIWQWLTQTRYVDIKFGNTNKDLHYDLQKRIEEIQIINFKAIITRLVKFHRDLELTNTGLLLTDEQAQERALHSFWQAKIDGKLDELNQICVGEEINA